MNSIMICEEASEESGFLSALYGSPGSFVHKALKDEQIECIHRIVCQRCFCRDTNGIRQERYILVNFKSVVLNGPYNRRHIKNHRKTPCFFVGLQSGTVPSPSSGSETLILITNETGGRLLQNNVQHCM